MTVAVVSRGRDAIPRRRLPAEDRRQELLRAAFGLIGSRPWDEVSMAEVARAAGASKPLVYHYFGSKGDLYVAAVCAAAEELRAATMPTAGRSLAAASSEALTAHLDWIDANADAYRTILQGGSHPDPAVYEIIEESRAETVERVARAFGIDARTPTRRLVLRGWVGFLEGVCLAWVETRDTPKEAVVRLLLDSLASVVPLAGG